MPWKRSISNAKSGLAEQNVNKNHIDYFGVCVCVLFSYLLKEESFKPPKPANEKKHLKHLKKHKKHSQLPCLTFSN